MTDPGKTGRSLAQPKTGMAREKKKPYRKPEFRFERVFETQALSCGKISITQGQCKHNLRNS